MKTDRIIIVGGGSAGWMTAATLSHQFPKKEITLIESPNAPIIGVGESTIGKINNWLSLLQIKDTDFMKHTDASYKLSIRFEDFYKKGAGAFHYPFQQPKTDNTANGLNDWVLRKDALDGELDVSDYADSYCSVMGLINNNTFAKDDIPDFLFNRDCAYHFDAIKFGQYLKNHRCKNVKHIVEDITEVETDERGIKNLNGKYYADLFIDCTGFKRLLIQENLKEEFTSYEDILPNNRALATHIEYSYGEIEKDLKPYTNCTAIENGWVWNIPLYSRMGAGYVYSDKYVTREQAEIEFKEHLKSQGLNHTNLKFKDIKFTPGTINRPFSKNVVAIGLASGFIEPLESNSLFTTHDNLLHLIRIINRGEVNQFDRDTYNLTVKDKFRAFAEFVAMHYALSHRDDTQYWVDVQNRKYEKNIDTNEFVRFTDGFTHAITDRMIQRQYPKHEGFNFIATGMRYFATDLSTEIKFDLRPEYDIELTKEHIVTATEYLVKQKNEWNELGKKQKSLYKYLKENIYENSTS
jgi:hypothetical protein